MLLRKLAEQWKTDPDYIYECLKYDLSEELSRIVKEKGLTKKELAEKMGVSPSYVSRILGADSISLRTIAGVLSVLGKPD